MVKRSKGGVDAPKKTKVVRCQDLPYDCCDPMKGNTHVSLTDMMHKGRCLSAETHQYFFALGNRVSATSSALPSHRYPHGKSSDATASVHSHVSQPVGCCFQNIESLLERPIQLQGNFSARREPHLSSPQPTLPPSLHLPPYNGECSGSSFPTCSPTTLCSGASHNQHVSESPPAAFYLSPVQADGDFNHSSSHITSGGSATWCKPWSYSDFSQASRRASKLSPCTTTSSSCRGSPVSSAYVGHLDDEDHEDNIDVDEVENIKSLETEFTLSFFQFLAIFGAKRGLLVGISILFRATLSCAAKLRWWISFLVAGVICCGVLAICSMAVEDPEAAWARSLFPSLSSNSLINSYRTIAGCATATLRHPRSCVYNGFTFQEDGKLTELDSTFGEQFQTTSSKRVTILPGVIPTIADYFSADVTSIIKSQREDDPCVTSNTNKNIFKKHINRGDVDNEGCSGRNGNNHWSLRAALVGFLKLLSRFFIHDHADGYSFLWPIVNTWVQNGSPTGSLPLQHRTNGRQRKPKFVTVSSFQHTTKNISNHKHKYDMYANNNNKNILSFMRHAAISGAGRYWLANNEDNSNSDKKKIRPWSFARFVKALRWLCTHFYDAARFGTIYPYCTGEQNGCDGHSKKEGGLFPVISVPDIMVCLHPVGAGVREAFAYALDTLTNENNNSFIIRNSNNNKSAIKGSAVLRGSWMEYITLATPCPLHPEHPLLQSARHHP